MGTDTAVGAGLDAEPSAMLPGIAAMAVRRLLPAPSLDRDRVLVGLHLGSAGWMEWRTAEQDARRLPVPSGTGTRARRRRASMRGVPSLP